MKLFLITDNRGWGWSKYIVRALDEDEAVVLTCPTPKHDRHRIQVEDLGEEVAGSRVLWTEDYSPDSVDYE